MSPIEPQADQSVPSRDLLEEDDQGLELPEALLQSPVFVMVQILRATRRMDERTPEGPTLAAGSVLACLIEFGPQSQRDLSRRLRSDPSDIVRVIDQLEARGHALRERDQRDRRRNAIVATPKGHAWLKSRMDTVEERAARYLPGLDADERALLRSLLLRVLAHHDARVPARYRDG
jgi:DNA-binding MarR family transcriptional regulator